MTLQADWRYCQKCHQIFFDGYPDKGHCSAGGSHEAAGFNFGLPYDVPASDNAQDAWRFCERCSVMYYDGYPDKGRCPVGGHEAAGFNFVLPHDVPATDNTQGAGQTDELRRLLAERQVVVVLGGSGYGKSSLVKAAIIERRARRQRLF